MLQMEYIRNILGTMTLMSGADTEKVSVNLGMVDLGQVDLLVEQGFYSNRTDFIRTAVRNQIQQHSSVVQEQLSSRVMGLGVVSYDRKALERLLDRGKMLELRMVGVVHLSSDVTPELALATISAVKVFGAFRASAAVKKALIARTEVW